jgi:hypothetical protein
MAISFSFLFLRRGAGAQGVETLEGNKGSEGSQTRLGGIVGRLAMRGTSVQDRSKKL